MAVELGVPGEAQACDHNVPTFGCSSCIQNDRQAFAMKSYEAWKKTYRLPKCPSCGNAMLHYGYNHDAKKVEALVICSRHDEDGVPLCEDEDMSVVIA